MKTTLILLFWIIAGSSLFAQGNLQFNQAIKLDLVGTQPVIPGNNYVQIALQNITVPVGKVWKIESTNANITKGQYNTSSSSNLLYFGGVPIIYMDDVAIHSTVPPANTGMIVIPHQIYWLPAGAHSFSLWLPSVTSAVTYSYTGSVTIIEFNIVP